MICACGPAVTPILIGLSAAQVESGRAKLTAMVNCSRERLESMKYLFLVW